MISAVARRCASSSASSSSVLRRRLVPPPSGIRIGPPSSRPLPPSVPPPLLVPPSIVSLRGTRSLYSVVAPSSSSPYLSSVPDPRRLDERGPGRPPIGRPTAWGGAPGPGPGASAAAAPSPSPPSPPSQPRRCPPAAPSVPPPSAAPSLLPPPPRGHRGAPDSGDDPPSRGAARNVVFRALSTAPQPRRDEEDGGGAGGEAASGPPSAAVPAPSPTAGSASSSSPPPPPPPPRSSSTSAVASERASEPTRPPPKSETPAKRRPEFADPPTLVGAATEFVRSAPGKAGDLTAAAAGAIARFLAAAPGVLWYYVTHPREFRRKLVDLKEAAKKEAHHYWMGTKLLAADLRTARQLLATALQGSSLTRRERKQLLRTVSDVFRLVPMSVFVLIPFMEFALPFALRVFPNMLPSTFQDSLKAEENMKRELKSRIAMAEFFQETLQDLAKEQKKRAAARKKKVIKDAADGSSSDGSDTPKGDGVCYEEREETAASFLEFIDKARKGEMMPPDVIIRFSKFFQDDLTLDNMPRMQLVNMCKYMNMPPYGSDNFLRLQLRFKMRSLQEDDQRILWEGIDSLTKMELREACRERGMRSTGLSRGAYRRALQQWLDLSVNKSVPISLLIMSRSFFLREEMTSRDDDGGGKSLAGLADAISGLDREVLNEVVLEMASSEERSRDPEVVKIKLEVLERQNEMIAEEKRARDEERAKREREQREREERELKEREERERGAREREEGARPPVPAAEAEVIPAGGAEGAERREAELLEVTVADAAPAEAEAEAEAAPEVREEPEAEPSLGKEPRIDGGEAPEAEIVSEEEGKEKEKEEEEEEKEERALSTEEMDAISQLACPDPVRGEREELERIKAAMKEEEDKEEEEGKEEGAAAAGEEKEEGAVAASSEGQAAEATAAVSEEGGREEEALGEEEALTAEEAVAPMKPEEADARAAETIAAADAAAKDEAEAATRVSFEGEVPPTQEPEAAPEREEEEKKGGEGEEEEEERGSGDDKLDRAIDRLRSKLGSMLGKIELQLTDVEAKIGDKLHFLDKDNDDMISMEEMALVLQSVLKRKLSSEEAMAIADDMDSNKDGFFTVAELTRWVETNRLVRLVEEGRDGEVDRVIAKQAEKVKAQREAGEEGSEGGEEGGSAEDGTTSESGGDGKMSDGGGVPPSGPASGAR